MFKNYLSCTRRKRKKSAVIERFNRTIKEQILKYFSANNTRKDIDVLDLLVDQYNNWYHSSIKMTPDEACREVHENKMWRNLFPEFCRTILTPKFSIGDNVRITKKKKTFDKGYTHRWTEEIFTISKIQLTIPITYKITDCIGEEIQGSFFERELQKTSQDVFRIENVLKTRGDKFLVKWMGYNDSFNQWVDNKDISK